MKRLFIHCGLHKSSTTALQAFLAARRQELAAGNFFYPRAGSIGNGHHNIAWELARDRQEMLRHGFGEECALLAGEVLATGQLRLKEWVFHFAYLEVVAMLRSLSGVRVVARPYDRLPAGGIVDDFLSLAGIAAPLATAVDPPRVNRRDDAGQSLSHFYANRTGRPAEGDAAAFLAALTAELAGAPLKRFRSSSNRETDLTLCSAAFPDGKPVPTFPGDALGLGSDLRQAFAERFDAGNRKLCEAEGLESGAIALAGAEEAGCVRLERLFSFELCDAARTASANPGVRQAEAARLAAWCRGGP